MDAVDEFVTSNCVTWYTGTQSSNDLDLLVSSLVNTLRLRSLPSSDGTVKGGPAFWMGIITNGVGRAYTGCLTVACSV